MRTYGVGGDNKSAYDTSTHPWVNQYLPPKIAALLKVKLLCLYHDIRLQGKFQNNHESVYQ